MVSVFPHTLIYTTMETKTKFYRSRGYEDYGPAGVTTIQNCHHGPSDTSSWSSSHRMYMDAGITRVQLWISSGITDAPGIVGLQVSVTMLGRVNSSSLGFASSGASCVVSAQFHMLVNAKRRTYDTSLYQNHVIRNCNCRVSITVQCIEHHVSTIHRLLQVDGMVIRIRQSICMGIHAQTFLW
jgi:hypothetical protein